MDIFSRNLNYVAPVFRVTDLARSLSYYKNQLGFDVDFNYKGHYASLVREGCYIHLKCSVAAARDQEAFEAEEPLDACFGVQDAQALASSFASSGATFSVSLRSATYGEEFYVRDPDGYILGFIDAAGRGKPPISLDSEDLQTSARQPRNEAS